MLQSIRTCFISIISCLNPFATSRQKNESEAKENRELNLAYAELIPMLVEMKVEASDISKAVGDSKRQLDAIDFETINPAILEKIYEDEVEFSDLRRRFYDLDEMYAILNTAFKNAPDLTSENGQHSKLLNNLKIELMEHHQKIKILTDIYLEETANILGVNDSHAASQFSMNP
ncbi:hypothetical protein [Marivirga sp.]|uniref:hypothetical protein n=1 Tax=Marivirga sp. TaxID=2018662 RepID=UPI0025E26F1A|nr:hypothetical protein [Marivirga sp.]